MTPNRILAASFLGIGSAILHFIDAGHERIIEALLSSIEKKASSLDARLFEMNRD